MPVYEYECEDCKSTMEINTPVAKYQEVYECHCGKTMRRKYSVPGIKFNGPGFYSTGG